MKKKHAKTAGIIYRDVLEAWRRSNEDILEARCDRSRLADELDDCLARCKEERDHHQAFLVKLHKFQAAERLVADLEQRRREFENILPDMYARKDLFLCLYDHAHMLGLHPVDDFE